MMRFNAILFNIVEQCNIRCRHCGYADSKRAAVSEEDELIDWAIQAVEYGIPHIIFTGGEPFMQFPLLKRSVEAVHKHGGNSGVFTNSLWGKTLESARETIKQLPGLTHLYLSTDIYHLEFVPIENILNVISAARELSIPRVIICITHTSEEDKEMITSYFTKDLDYINFHYGKVIPSPQVQNLVPDAYDCMHEFIPNNFSHHCFLHTPLVNANGTLSTCHIGKVETHLDIKSSPYYLGNLKEEKLKDIFDRSEQNAVYQFLRTYGPKGLVNTLLTSPMEKELKDQCFSCDCHMCFMVFLKKDTINIVENQAQQKHVQNNIFLKRILTLGDTI
ncbi:MAG: radical SAM protein [Blastocatellia bacterium]|nr:radical SAM protein [Blastocatellia bacterium]